MAESVIINLINNVLDLTQAVSPAGTNGITFILTFFTAFAISFTAIGLVPNFKEDNKKMVRVIISLAIAYFSATTPIVTTSVEKVFPSVGIIIIGAAAFMLTIYFIFEEDMAKKIVKFGIGPLVVGVMLMLFWGAITEWETPLFQRTADGIILAGFQITNYDIALGILIIIFIIFMIWAVGGGTKLTEGVRLILPNKQK